jgi:hypothetical protein
LTTQARLDWEKPRSFWMAGNATFTMVMSRTIMSIPVHSTMSAAHRESLVVGLDEVWVTGPLLVVSSR